MTDHEWLDDHVELYAVDSLPADEHAEVDTRLDLLGPDERAEYDDLIADVRDLMHDYARRYTRDAPGTLRARVLADFEAGVGKVHTRHALPIDRRRRRHRMAVAVCAAAASVAALFAGGVLVGRSLAPDPQTNVQADAAAAVFSAEDATLSTGRLDDARGVLTVVTSRSRNQAVATLRDVRNRVPDDRTLQLWAVGGQAQPISAGLFDDASTAPILIDALNGTSAFAVTVEPRGGSQAPTTALLTQVKV